ncbi:hypothetical protein GZH82_12070 [Staphylococcus ursi]|uniref:hypothetical protein n=1 Tax=Staphylococcus sp. MI 10-1553 TaxID=1912064 RepID=UPI0013994060|nr:hypothetical protein [Staphylococcus sp. MI 10-1553]QHW38023.1 hypothetical protein GZH82_12070 [Staphylococcus sp. MI 10-1553]
MNNIITLKTFNTKAAVKVTLAILTLTYFSQVFGATEILSLLKNRGINITPGLAEGLAAASTVGDVNSILAAAVGVTVAPWIAVAIAGVSAASL